MDALESYWNIPRKQQGNKEIMRGVWKKKLLEFRELKLLNLEINKNQKCSLRIGKAGDRDDLERR